MAVSKHPHPVYPPDEKAPAWQKERIKSWLTGKGVPTDVAAVLSAEDDPDATNHDIVVRMVKWAKTLRKGISLPPPPQPAQSA